MASAGLTRWVPGAALALGGILTVGWAFGGYQPVLHEQFEPDAKEDLTFGVRVTTGALPAAVQTKEGILPLPDPVKPPQPKEPTYGEVRGSSAPQLRMDNQTTDPGRLSYHEPFRPSIAPFKRTHVYDGVTAEFTLVVSDERVRPVTLAEAPTASMDQFFADLVVDLKGDESLVIPSVGPHMKVFSAHLEPEAAFGFYVDRAENWFLRAPGARGRSRLVMHVGVERAVFQGQVTASSYSALVNELPVVPSNVERVAAMLLPEIGVSRVMAPADAVSRLVTYFRGFAESAERPNATFGEALYRELVTSRKGVCRHRAYAFMVTALGLGIPARFVHNEAHAWVEVYGGSLWHRIDLGGAASSFDYRGEPPVGKPHTPPPDPFSWPRKTERTENALPPPVTTPGAQGSTPTLSEQGNPTVTLQESPPSPHESTKSEPPSTELPLSGRISVSVGAITQVRRSRTLAVTGSVDSAKAGCGKVRVELALVQNKERFAVGATTTEASGHFTTQLVVPSDMPVGKYELFVTSLATKTCPAAAN